MSQENLKKKQSAGVDGLSQDKLVLMTEVYKCLKRNTHGLVYTNIWDPAQTYSRIMNYL